MVEKIPPLSVFQDKLNSDSPVLRKRLICLDPGETTGAAVFNDGKLVLATHIPTKDLVEGVNNLRAFFIKHLRVMSVEPFAFCDNHLIVEDYRIYSWKTDQHTWAGLHTPKLIGAILALSVVHSIPVTMQMAFTAKQFVTDAKLSAWGLRQVGRKHSNDAIRHGVYYMLFNKDHVTKK